MSRRDELKALTESWNAAWNGGDASALAAFFTDDATFYEPGLDAGPVSAAAGIVASAEATWRDWPGATFGAVSTVIDGDTVALEWRSSATHKSGRSLTLEGVDVLEWRGDKIASCRVYFDVAARRDALS